MDIHPYVKPGENLIVVQLVVQRRTDGLLDMLKVMGDFGLSEKDGESLIVKARKTMNAGDWCLQGYPYYSGTGTYSVTMDIPEDYCQGKVFLQAECGEDVLEIQVNEHEPVIIPWHPYRVNISSYIKPGKNYINMKVTNTLINILEAVKKPSGLLKAPKILHYNTCEIIIDND